MTLKSGKVCIARTMAIDDNDDIDEDRDDDSDEDDEDDTPCDDDSETRREAMISDGLDCKPGFRVVCGLPQHDCRQCLAKYGFLLQLPGII